VASLEYSQQRALSGFLWVNHDVSWVLELFVPKRPFRSSMHKQSLFAGYYTSLNPISDEDECVSEFKTHHLSSKVIKTIKR
jgi:hypothetical protein